MSVTIKAWLSIGSTYTYLTALRLRSVVEGSGIKLEIRPISIRQIMKNMDNIPFPPSKKTKVDYMWRDIQRRAEFSEARKSEAALKLYNVLVDKVITDEYESVEAFIEGIKNLIKLYQYFAPKGH